MRAELMCMLYEPDALVLRPFTSTPQELLIHFILCNLRKNHFIFEKRWQCEVSATEAKLFDLSRAGVGNLLRWRTELHEADTAEGRTANRAGGEAW